MGMADHRRTACWGGSPKSASYREAQKQLLDSGNIMRAFNMDVNNLHSLFGSKYDAAINQARTHLQNIMNE